MKFKKSGYSLLETLVAIGIASIVMTSALSIVASIHYSQKRLQFTQDFYSEGRYLMERVAQIIRNNTIDYDYFFVQYGPPDTGGGACGADFNSDQVSDGVTTNDASNREDLGYETIFFWDTNSDGTQNRNLGGRLPDGSEDPCSFAWGADDEPLQNLYLINANRNLRTAIGFDAGSNDIVVRRQLAVDTDDDGRADVWAPNEVAGDPNAYDASTEDTQLLWNSGSNVCEITYYDASITTNITTAVMGDSGDQDFCDQAYDFTSIVPPAIQVNNLSFRPAPNQDPFLAFRIDEAQVHPHVFLYLDLEIDNPSRYGFDVTNKPAINLQTAVGSRVFGNIRR